MEPVATSDHYDRSFYETVNSAGAASAQRILPHALSLLGPRTVVDIGCGTGIWASEARRLGAQEVVGVDGAYVPADQRVLSPAEFVERDLRHPLDLGRQFDLAICLEVGEHLPEKHASHLVAEIVAAAPAVLFSAAPPGQGGTDHVNEQWPDYWITLFQDHDYSAWDVIRPLIRHDQDVAWIYRQNVLLVLAEDHPLCKSLPPSSRLESPAAGDVSFEYVARYLLEREDGLKQTVRRLPRLVAGRARRSFGR